MSELAFAFKNLTWLMEPHYGNGLSVVWRLSHYSLGYWMLHY